MGFTLIPLHDLSSFFFTRRSQHHVLFELLLLALDYHYSFLFKQKCEFVSWLRFCRCLFQLLDHNFTNSSVHRLLPVLKKMLACDCEETVFRSSTDQMEIP